jgi:hypothetical protein
MALKLRVGVSNMPVAGDTLSVYYTGTTNTVSPIFSPDSVGATLSNPFTVPVDGWYGFEPATTDRVDVYWHEQSRNLVEDVSARDMSLALPLDQTNSPSIGQGIVWDGNKFIYTAIPTSVVSRTVYSYTATQDQYNFSCTYDVQEHLDVYLNGHRLDYTEFTATSGSDISLIDPTNAGEKIVIISYNGLYIV